MPVPNTPNYYGVQNPTFQRATRNILSITQARQALITTTFDGINPGDHQYSTGLIVRIYVPYGFGMTLLNEVEAPITIVNSSQFTIPVDTTGFDPFIVPNYQPGNFGTPAQVVPIGEVNDILTMATQNVLPYP
jgi:hypothetical protein